MSTADPAYYAFLLDPAAEGAICFTYATRMDDALAIAALHACAALPASETLAIASFSSTLAAFDAIAIAPAGLHRHLGGWLDDAREETRFCIPVYRCELGGNEDRDRFMAMLRAVPFDDWSRAAHPRILLRHDFPSTGEGSGDGYVLTSREQLTRLVERLPGTGGFLEILNYRDEVREIIDQAGYVLIANRDDANARQIGRDELLADLDRFLRDPLPEG